MKILRARNIIIALVIIAVIVVIFLVTRDKGPGYEFATVIRGDVTEEVSVTGKLKPAQDVDLAFETSGRVASVPSGIGDWVYAGQALVRLDSSELETELSKSESDLATQKAKLSEEKTTLDNLYTSIPNVLNDAYIKADDAVRTKISGLFSGSKNSVYSLTFTTCDETSRIGSTEGKLSSEIGLDEWKTKLASLSAASPKETLEAALTTGWSYLNVVAKFLNSLNQAINADCIVSDSSLSTYRTNLSTARTNVQTVTTAISDKEQAIALQKAVVNSSEAALQSYEASVSNIKARLSKTVIYSPISGVVTAQEAKTGEIISANETVVSVISASRLEVEANIPEVDVTKVKIGSAAEVVLDAYGSDVIFEATVSEINPAETVIEGVPTYKTTFQFKEKDERLKSGMTADITILTEVKSGVLYVPQRAVVRENGRTYVRVEKDGLVSQVDVTVGLRGSDGVIEILGGLNEGDKVITFINK